MVRCSCGGSGSGCSCVVQGGGYAVVSGTGTVSDPYIVTYQPQVNNQTGTTYTPTLADGGDILTMSNTSPVSITLPSDANLAFPVGQEFTVININTGLVSITAGSGASISGATLTIATGVGRRVIKRAANAWIVI